MVVKNLRSGARLGAKPLFITAVAGVILALGALTGCGTAGTPGAGGTGSHEPAKGTLTIRLTDKAAHTTTHWSLRCEPAGGTAPDPAALCKALFGTSHPLHLFTPIRRMCPMIMISGKQITVNGTWHGKAVHRVFIDGGCDLPVFNSLNKIFG